MQWKVGKVKITKIVELETVGSTRFILPLATNEEIQKLPWLIPHFATEEGRLKMSIHSLVVETPTRRIVVDTGLGNDKQGRNVPTWNNRKDAVPGDADRGGLSARQHRHRAVHASACRSCRLEYEARRTANGCRPSPMRATCSARPNMSTGATTAIEPDKAAVFNDSVKPIVDAGQADLIAERSPAHRGDQLIPTPGHSPGHMSIHIRSDGEEGLLTGDVAHHPCQMAHLDWSSTADSDPRQSRGDAARAVLALCRQADAGDRRAFRCRPSQAGGRCASSSSRWYVRCPGTAALRACNAAGSRPVEFHAALFHERCSSEAIQPIFPRERMTMKLVRYGNKGAEKPGLIDKSGQLRDLSAHIRDLDGRGLFAGIAEEAGRARPRLPARRLRQAALRRPRHRHLQIRRDRPEL